MSKTTIIGIDPGIVDTGFVALTFDTEIQMITADYLAISGMDVAEVKKHVDSFNPARVFIEDYDPRKNFNTNQKMSAFVALLKQALPDAVMKDNAGVATMVPPQLLKLYGVWSFAIPTHHNDLRSAARIAILGMMQDKQRPELGALLNTVTRAHLRGSTWRTVSHVIN